MKLDIISDIHLTHIRQDHGTEFISGLISENDAPILILAGDVGEFHWWQRVKDRIQALCDNYEHVVYVAGNHDYYGTTFEEGDARFREIESQIENFHFLEQEIREINGVKIAGCTLWFEKDPGGWIYERWMCDFELINEFKPGVYDRNAASQEFLHQMGNVDVVVTHHIPSQGGIAPKYKDDPLNRFFLCEMEDVIFDLRPKFWVFGHTHTFFNFTLRGTRLLANPLGYPKENYLRREDYKPVTIEV